MAQSPLVPNAMVLQQQFEIRLRENLLENLAKVEEVTPKEPVTKKLS